MMSGSCSHYLGADGQSLRQLQKMLTFEIQAAKRREFFECCSNDDYTRLKSCALKGASDWLTDVDAALCMSDHDVAVAANLRLGLAPTTAPLPSLCPLCKQEVANNHHLYCRTLLRKTINQRHDRAQNGLARYARSNSCLVHITPKTSESRIPDLELVLVEGAWMIDLSGIHPLAPSYKDQVVGVPGHAPTIRENAKSSKYCTFAKSQGKEFSAFGIESYGGLGKGAQKVLELIGLEGLAGGSPNRMSRRSFRAWLSVDWQRSNARILREWLRRVREKL